MASETGNPGHIPKNKKASKSRLSMYSDFHPDIDDPDYVEKLRRLYPDLENPEWILDLGHQAIYRILAKIINLEDWKKRRGKQV